MVAATSTHYREPLVSGCGWGGQGELSNRICDRDVSWHLWTEDPEDDKDEVRLNPNVPVDGNTPPTFIVQAMNDPVDGVNNSLVYYLALKKAKVPVEMHLYAQGGHGFGLRRTNFPDYGMAGVGGEVAGDDWDDFWSNWHKSSWLRQGSTQWLSSKGWSSSSPQTPARVTGHPT